MEEIEWLVEVIEKKIEEKKRDYYKFMVLIMKNNNEINQILKKVDFYIININRIIPEHLFDIPSKLQAIKTQQIITDAIINNSQDVIVMDNFELLFSPILKAKPIELFRELSRYKIIIVVWRYAYENSKLVYAIPEHSEYQEVQINKNEIIIY